MNQVDLSKFQKTLTLDSGLEYQISLLNAWEGIRLGNQIKGVILPLFGGTIDGINSSDDFISQSTPFTNIAITLCDQLDKVQLEGVIGALLKGLVLKEQGKAPKDLNPTSSAFEEHFMANYGELIEVLAFSLRENFGSLFTGKGIHLRLMEAVTGMGAPSTEE